MENGCKMVEAKSLRERLLAGPTVDIYVGPDKKRWTLHQNLLCHYSAYFEMEFVGHEVPKKAPAKGNNKLELPRDDPRGFELLVKWMYQGELEDMSAMDDERKYEYAIACQKLYLLCNKFDMIALKNAAIDQYRRALNEAQLVPDPDEIDEIYRESPANSPFRHLMTKIAARQIMDPDIEKDAQSYRKCFENNADFAVEMVNSIRQLSGGILFDDPTEGSDCLCHDHSDGQKCDVARKRKDSLTKDAANSIATAPKPAKRMPRKLANSGEASGPTKGTGTNLKPNGAVSKPDSLKESSSSKEDFDNSRKQSLAPPQTSNRNDRRSSSATLGSRPGKVSRVDSVLEGETGNTDLRQNDIKDARDTNGTVKPSGKKRPRKLGRPTAAQPVTTAVSA